MPLSYRDIFKWGESSSEEDLEPELVRILSERLDFTHQVIAERPGTQPIDMELQTRLDDSILSKYETIVGADNLSTETTDLLRHAHGKSYVDVLKERKLQFDEYPDAVLYPRSEPEIEEILNICQEHQIPVVPLGGMTSVTAGIEFNTGGIALDLTRHMNSVIELSERASTVKIQAGILGPDLESYLNSYRSEFDDVRGYTCGHFPQSFVYSTVGGWVATRSAGQESTGYGKIEDMVLGLRMVTPQGILDLPTYPAKALGPDLLQLVIGSEGSYGVITEVTMKIRRQPLANKYAAFLVKSWEDGITTVREIMQQRGGTPFLCRLSDPEESGIYLKLSGFGGLKGWIIDKLGYKEGKRVLFMVSTAGPKQYTKSTMKYIKTIVRQNNGIYVGSSPVQDWIDERFETPYLRDTLMDHNLVIDTLETATTWDNIHNLWKNVRTVIKDRDNIIAMTHISHMYENGGNLYFIFITKEPKSEPIEQYEDFQHQVIDAIKSNGGSLSHHHGIGRLFGAYLDEEIGELGIDILQKIKQRLDPKYVMNPGVLGINNGE